MRKIFKYELKVRERQPAPWPGSGEVLSIQMQGEKLCAWVAIDPNLADVSGYGVQVHGTGHPIVDYAGLRHLATVQDGAFVWHVFREMPFDV